MANGDLQRSVLGRIPRMAREPRRPWRDVVFICDEYEHFATVGENDPGGDEKVFSLSRQARLVALVATQSISSLRSALQGESWRTQLQTFRTRVFLTLADEVSGKRASEACGQVERLKEQYSISESSQAGVGLLSGRAGEGKGTFGVTKSYLLRREPVFQPSAIAQRAGDCGCLRRAQPAATYVLLSQAVAPVCRPVERRCSRLGLTWAARQALGGAAHLPLARCPGLARCLRPGRKTGVGSESRSVRLQLPYRSGRVWRGMIGLARAGYAAISNTAVVPPCGPGLMMTGQAAKQAFERAVRPCRVSQFRPDNGTRPPRSRSPS